MTSAADSILAPRPGERILLPAMAASREAAHDPFGRRLPALYPRRTLWVDFGAANGGDGTPAAPFNSLAPVLEDETLLCVCRHLGCDRIPVRVRGIMADGQAVALSAGASESRAVIDGGDRDYCRHLELLPWPDGARWGIRAEYAFEVSGQQGARFHFQERLDFVRALHGAVLRGCDLSVRFTFLLREPRPERFSWAIVAELAAFRDCRSLALFDCSFAVETAVKGAAVQQYILDGGGGGGGGGRGRYGWGGGGGGGAPAAYVFPTPVPVAPAIPANDLDATCRAHFLRSCPSAFGRGGSCDLLAHAGSDGGADATATAFHECVGMDAEGFAARLRAEAIAEGRGEEYHNSDGSYGVRRFALTARALAAYAARCGGRAAGCSGLAAADAECRAGNRPFHVARDGGRTDYPVGGYAAATAAGTATGGLDRPSPLGPTLSVSASHPSDARPREADAL